MITMQLELRGPIWMLCIIFTALLAQVSRGQAASSKPNVLLIMTDDQDILLDSLSVQPNVRSLLGENGIFYEKHYCTVAWCCPSRVNLFTGRAAHNTNVTALSPPYGGYPKFLNQKLNDNYLPVWINDSGIRTYYVGKFMNSYNMHNFHDPHPRGWTHSSFLVDPYTYHYFQSHWTDGYTDTITAYDGLHTTEVTQNKALAVLNDAAATGEQFFMMVTPVAPHAQVINSSFSVPPSPSEFEGVFSNRIAPRVPNFNPDVPSGASWVYNIPKQTESQVRVGDEHHYHRLENLAGIDLMVAALVQKLEEHKILDNTYILYTSDNGFHIGNHRLNPGKRCGYETDINIPLLIRGPGVPKNVTTNITNSHTDMAPTVLTMLGLPLRPDFDGQPIAYTASELLSSNKSEYVNVEFWDAKEDQDETRPGSYYNNTYKSLRLQTAGESFYYSVWCDGEREFYDMKNDYYQMDNLLRRNIGPARNTMYFGRPAAQLFARLDTLLLVLKGCAQDSCRNAYGVLFPGGQATDLAQAMSAKYDAFFAVQPAVSFAGCIPGHIVDLEGPQNAYYYSSTGAPILTKSTGAARRPRVVGFGASVVALVAAMLL